MAAKQTCRENEETPPPVNVVMNMVMGAWVSQTISSITRLDIPDLLKEHGPMTALQLTRDCGVDAKTECLERALRACASIGIFTEDKNGIFGPTLLSEVLTLHSPVSIKKFTEIFGVSWWRVWGSLDKALKTGEQQDTAQLGMSYWEYCKANPKEMEDFGEAMKSNSLNTIRGVLEQCNLTGVEKVVDVGGGFGHLLIALLKKYRTMHGILLEMPNLIPLVKERLREEEENVTARLELIGGDMFEHVPTAQVYIMKNIIHDWGDERCVQLLKNCQKRMDGNGRIICVDAELPAMGDMRSIPAKFLDINMMLFHAGKERTRKQWEALFDAAGLSLHSIKPLDDNFGMSIIEGVKY